MRTRLLSSFLVVLALAAVSALAFAGNNPVAKVAVHVQPHGSETCGSMPDISGCEGVNHTYSGCGEIDVFPVFWGLTEYKAFEYSFVWPAEWGTCSYTSCSDLAIYKLEHYGDPDALDPGDTISQAYFDCHPGDYLEIPGFGWLSASTPGRVCLGGLPPWLVPEFGFAEPEVLDCNGTIDPTICAFCAGVCGMPGQDGCELPSSAEAVPWGKIKAIFE